MNPHEQPRPVFLTREQRDQIATVCGWANTDKLDEVIAAWDAAPADAWVEIADEKRKHRAHCNDGDCFAENVMLRLGGIKPMGLSPFDLPGAGSSLPGAPTTKETT